ncbi:hypothetical protein [Maritimibacter dapengensis]|uniref:Uncharacterized protein n=1 Tax=Maritimibacter dapengensis TaxID=2836868 RepID=A0ABS6SYA2_9RHOB|nr:hypothetical protein [Maritimibacter dapengensis]MBV7377946.1 hypothetical protein [Maritimibacter dapengensis]
MKSMAVLTASLALAAAPVFADDVTDTMSSALQAYEEGDIDYAIEELEYAKSLLTAMKSNALSSFLPVAPEGYTREIQNNSSNVMGFIGGGTHAEAEYTNGTDTFTVMMVADNPMIAATGAMISNAAMLGMKIERVGRQKFINDDGTLTALVDNRIMVQAEGAEVGVLLMILSTIDYASLQTFGG